MYKGKAKVRAILERLDIAVWEKEPKQWNLDYCGDAVYLIGNAVDGLGGQNWIERGQWGYIPCWYAEDGNVSSGKEHRTPLGALLHCPLIIKRGKCYEHDRTSGKSPCPVLQGIP